MRTENIRTDVHGNSYLHVWHHSAYGHGFYEEQKGDLFRSEWTNLAHSALPFPSTKCQLVQDVRKGLPYPSDSFDAAYCHSILEHLTLDEADRLAGEFFRVLKPGSHFRLAVPDLEDKCRIYLRQLELYEEEATQENLCNYEWAVLHLIDLIVRDNPGGKIGKRLNEGDCNWDFVRKLWGDAFSPERYRRETIKRRSDKRNRSLRELAFALRRRLFLILTRRDPRLTGEADKWAYDRLSLRLILESAGFSGCEVKKFNESNIEGWERFRFDESNYGPYEIRPSIYIEGKKPD